MKKLYRNDLILNILIVLLCIALPAFLYFHGRNDEKYAVISCGGDVEKILPLNEDSTFSTHGVNITVQDGHCFVSSSSCPDGLCTKMKKAKNSGDSIICVPNRVSVKISGNAGEDGIDVIAG